MKALILSFFVVILGYSLIFDEEPKADQPVLKDSNSVYFDKSHCMPEADSLYWWESENRLSRVYRQSSADNFFGRK